MGVPGKKLNKRQQKLAAANLGLAYARARTWAGRLGVDMDDLIGPAQIALCRAVRAFDPAKGRIGTLAYRCIDHEIIGWHNRYRKHTMAQATEFGLRQRPDHRIAVGVDAIDVWEKSMALLDSREQAVLSMRLRFGKTLGEVGQVIGVSRERVRQIQYKAIAKCRAGLLETECA